MTGGKTLVRAYIEAHPGEIVTLQMIYAHFAGKLSKGAVRTILSRYSGQLWHSLGDGCYESVSALVRPEPFDPRLRFHGLKVAYVSEKGDRAVFRPVLERVTSQLQSPWTHRPHEGAVVLTDDWEGRFVTLTAFPSVCRLEAWLKASTRPLHPVLDFLPFASYLYGTTRIPPELWRVEEVGVNEDFPGVRASTPMRFELPAGMSLAGFNSAWGQIYNKEVLEAARADLHLAAPSGTGPTVGFLIDRVKSVALQMEAHFTRDREGVRP